MLKVCITNFWEAFSLDEGFLKYLLDLSGEPWSVCGSQEQADLVFTSVFPHAPARFPHKTICVIWENARPNYRFYHYSLSSDPDSYGGRNIRVPLWYTEIGWTPEYRRWNVSGGGSHGNEPLLHLPALLEPRTRPFRVRPRFCGFVASNPESYRLMAAEALGRIGEVEMFGPVAGTVDRRSKYEILRDHTFNLCFENSLFPGYHTEKLIQAWAAGAVPLYFGDSTVAQDFNPAAFLNAHDFPSLAAFAVEVERLYKDRAALEAMWRERLLLRAPSLTPAVWFLRQAIAAIHAPN